MLSKQLNLINFDTDFLILIFLRLSVIDIKQYYFPRI